MLSVRTKHLAGNLTVIALWIGTVVLALAWALPSLQRFKALQHELSDVESKLENRLRGTAVPSESAIGAAEDVRDGLVKGLEDSNEFYLGIQKDVLERQILKSGEDDPYRVASEFKELNDTLEEKAGSARFLDLGEVGDWRDSDDGKPEEKQFKTLEKKSCIAESLVHVLAIRNDEKRAEISSMSIGDPCIVPGRPETPTGDVKGVRFRVFPVDIFMNIPFSILEEVFIDLFSMTPGAEKPFVAARSMKLYSRDSGDDERVGLELGLNVLDFYLPGAVEPER